MLNMTRRLKRLFCRLLIGTLLFAQMAIAAYACPQLSPTGFSQPSAAPAMASMGKQAGPNRATAGSATMTPAADMPPCCDGMGRSDPNNPNLCAGHCQFGQQSDQTRTPTMPAALLTRSFYTVSPAPEPTAPTRPVATSAGILAATSPPHVILHCCFRN